MTRGRLKKYEDLIQVLLRKEHKNIYLLYILYLFIRKKYQSSKENIMKLKYALQYYI